MTETKTTVPASKAPRPTWKPAGKVHAGEQPFSYPLKREFIEPDWTRLPGYKNVSKEEWETALWQRRHTVKNLRECKEVFGDLMPDSLFASVERDIRDRATMSILIPPHMLNTMDEKDLWNDPVRRYMLPAFEDRHPEWPSHPKASRDSLHEADMWAVEGLTHRYPTKVLAELLSTCPQYCGHCTRMDLVGNDVPQVVKLKFQIPQKDRYQQMLDYLRVTPSVRDVVVSGGDIANTPIGTLEEFCSKLMDIPNIRDIRLATKGLIALPQHFLQSDVLAGLERLAKKAREKGVDIAVHTHVNNARQVTPLVRKAVEALLDYGKIMPYYFYQCDMIPNAEHWRLAIHEVQQLQHDVMGYLPGFATPRMVCDVPFVGKRWVHQVKEYDRQLGISYWTKNYRTGIETDDPEALSRRYEYFDPVYTLPELGQQFWRGSSVQQTLSK